MRSSTGWVVAALVILGGTRLGPAAPVLAAAPSGDERPVAATQQESAPLDTARTRMPVVLAKPEDTTRVSVPGSGSAAPAGPIPKWKKKPGTYAVIETSFGTIVCRLFTETAPKTVANFIGLATGAKEWKDPRTGAWRKQPYYDGRTFYRVIDDFMIQGGGPLPDGTGSPGFTIPDEIDGRTLFDRPGRMGMAKHEKPNSGDCQFFITIKAAPHLNNKHTIFGQVEEGQAVVNAIGKVPRKPSGDPKVQPWSPLKPVVMKVRIEEVKAGTP